MESFNVIKNIIDCIELSLYPKNRFLCEPNLGKRNLYPTLGLSDYNATKKKTF